MNSDSLAEIQELGKDFAAIHYSDRRYLSPLWSAIAQIVRAIPSAGATTEQIQLATSLSANTVRGYLRALIASGFPISSEKEGAKNLYFVRRSEIRWLDQSEGTSPNSPKAKAARLLLAAGWSVKDIAVATGLSPQRLYQIRSGDIHHTNNPNI